MIALKRGFLIGMLVLIGIAALVCVGMLLMGTRGRDQETAMISALLWGYCLVLAFGAFYVLERGTGWLKAWAGIGLVSVALAVMAMPIYFWWESHWYEWYGGRGFRPGMADEEFREFVGKLSGTLMVLMSWLVLTPWVLTPKVKWGAILQGLTAVCLTLTTIIFLGAIWSHSLGRDWETGMLAGLILSGAGALAVLVLNKFMAIKVPNILTSVTQSLWIRCPRCLKEQEIASGESRCVNCRLLFKVEVEEPRCDKCGYNLHALTRPVCPECGNVLGAEEIGGPA